MPCKVKSWKKQVTGVYSILFEEHIQNLQTLLRLHSSEKLSTLQNKNVANTRFPSKSTKKPLKRFLHEI
jgi:hypothetical protein